MIPKRDFGWHAQCSYCGYSTDGNIFCTYIFYSVNHIISFLGRKLSVACLLYIKMIFSLDSINHLLFIKARYRNKSILGCEKQTSGVSTNHHDIWINWPTSKMLRNIHIRISAFFSTFFVHHSHYSFMRSCHFSQGCVANVFIENFTF